MPKILNLDKLVEEGAANRRVLRINGVDHAIHEMTVDNFIYTTLEAERLVKENSVVEQVKASVEMICRSVPTAPREVLGAYSMEVLHTILAFVRGDEVEEAEEQLAAAQAKEDGSGAGN